MTERMNGNVTGPALMDVDRLLCDFYRAEMPDPWPRLALPAPARQTPPRFARNFFRFALAASVVVALLAFWGVAGMFPKDAATGIGVGGPEIGKKLDHHLSPVEHIRTPSGDAQIFEEGLSNGQGQVINVIAPSQTKGPR
jgi:hypothetical protein